MAAVTHATVTTTTTDTTSYTSGAFTPAANDLLVVFVVGPDTAATGTMTDSQGLSFTLVASALYNASASKLYWFIANALAAASSMTVTFDCTGDTATGTCISVERVSGMTKTGATALRQSAKQENQTTNASPAPVFPGSCLTGNPTLMGFGIEVNPAAMTPPTNWVELCDSGFTTPNAGIEVSSRDSGFTGTTITWTDTTGAFDWGISAIELDTSSSGSNKAITPATNISATSTFGGSVAKLARVTAAQITATATLAGSVAKLASIRPPSIAATSTQSGSVVALRGIQAGTFTCPATLTGTVTDSSGVVTVFVQQDLTHFLTAHH